MTALLAGAGSEAISKGFSTEANSNNRLDLISCGGGGGGGGGGNAGKKRAAKKALQAELKKMIEAKKANKK